MSDAVHMLRYGTHAEQKYFASEMHDTYDCIVFAANLVAYSPGGISGVLAHKAHGKPFVVDPQCYAFQLDPGALMSEKNDGSVTLKRSVQKLTAEYGAPVESIAGKRPLTPGAFPDETHIAAFCRRCLDFQRSYILEEAKQQDYFDMIAYAASASEEDAEQLFRPRAIVAPSFYLGQPGWQQWLALNMDMLRAASAAATSGEEIWAALVCDEDVVGNMATRDRILDALRSEQVSNCLLWLSGFDEHEASVDTLREVRELADGARKRRIRLHNLYGGYFSIILAKAGLFSGVCHGPEWGESRTVEPVGGGVPISKFYYPKLHQRLPFARSLNYARASGGLSSLEAYYENVCDCTECREHIEEPQKDFRVFGVTTETRFIRRGTVVSMPYPTPETSEHCVRHYLWNKEKEFHEYGQTLEEAREHLQASHKWATDTLGPAAAPHLYRWRKALS